MEGKPREGDAERVEKAGGAAEKSGAGLTAWALLTSGARLFFVTGTVMCIVAC